MNHPIAQAFGIEEETPNVPSTEVSLTPDEVENKTKALRARVEANINVDYTFARENIRTMIDQSMVAIPNLIDLIQQAESPRMYESGAAFLRTLAELNKDLLNISNEIDKSAPKKADLASTAQPAQPVGDTNIYIGTGGDIFARLSKPKVTDPIGDLPVING